MKHLLSLAGILVLAGCANNSTPHLSDQPQYSPDGTRSYSQQTLQKTGQQTPGEALAQVDPAVTVSHH